VSLFAQDDKFIIYQLLAGLLQNYLHGAGAASQAAEKVTEQGSWAGKVQQGLKPTSLFL
jgi:hypothetical protein